MSEESPASPAPAAPRIDAKNVASEAKVPAASPTNKSAASIASRIDAKKRVSQARWRYLKWAVLLLAVGVGIWQRKEIDRLMGAVEQPAEAEAEPFKVEVKTKYVPDLILREAVSRNDYTRNMRDAYKEHREHVTSFVLKGLDMSTLNVQPFNVLLLGAGNCNDIDILQVMKHGKKPHIHLADIDEGAMQYCIDSWLPAADDDLTHMRSRITYSVVDLSGVLPEAEEWLSNKKVANGTAIDKIIQELEGGTRHWTLNGDEKQRQKFEMVVALSMQTHISMDEVGLAMDLGRHPRFSDLVTKVHSFILAQAFSRLNEQGVHMIFSDVVTAEAVHNVMRMNISTVDDPEVLRELMMQTIEKKQFLHGGNIYHFMEVAVNDPLYKIQVKRDSSKMLLPPWKWQIHPKRLVLAGGHMCIKERVQPIVTLEPGWK